MRFNPVDFSFIAALLSIVLIAFFAASDVPPAPVCGCCPPPNTMLAIWRVEV